MLFFIPAGKSLRTVEAAISSFRLSSVARELSPSLQTPIDVGVCGGPAQAGTQAPRQLRDEPMASSTCDGCTLPDEQADPDDTAIPSRSRAIRAVSARNAGSAEQDGIRQARGSGANEDPSHPGWPQARLQPLRSSSTRRIRQASVGGRHGGAEAGNAGHILGSRPTPFSWPPPRSSGSTRTLVAGSARPRPLGRRSCGPKRKIGAECFDINASFQPAPRRSRSRQLHARSPRSAIG